MISDRQARVAVKLSRRTQRHLIRNLSHHAEAKGLVVVATKPVLPLHKTGQVLEGPHLLVEHIFRIHG